MRSLFPSLMVLALVLPCLPGCGGFAGKPPETVTIRDDRSSVVISDTETIASLTERMKRARKVSETRPRYHYTHKLELLDTWLYDRESGRFTLLTVMDWPEYELAPEDRRWLNERLEANRRR